MTTRRARRQRSTPPHRTDLLTALRQFATSWSGIISFSVTLVALVLLAGAFRIPPFDFRVTPTPDPWGVIAVPNSGGVVKVAYIGDTSGGSDSSGAEPALRHVLKDRSTIKDKDVRVELVTYQDACKADEAEPRAQELAADPELVAVIAAACPASALTYRRVFEEAHLAYLVLGNHDAELTPTGGQVTFRLSWNTRTLGKDAAVSAFQDIDARRALVVHDGTEPAETTAREFTTAFRSQRKDGTSGQVPDMFAVTNPGEVQTIGRRLAAFEPDLVFFAGSGQLAAAIRRELAAQRYQGRLLVSDAARADEAFVALGAAREGTYALEAALPRGTGYDAWKEAYERDNGPVGPLSAEANDAMLLVLQALDTVAQTRGNKVEIGRRVFANVLRVAPVEGVTGRLSFDGRGDRSVSMVQLVRFSEGAYVQVPKVTPTPLVTPTPEGTPSGQPQTGLATAAATFAAGATPTLAAASGPGTPTPGAGGPPPAAGAPAPSGP